MARLRVLALLAATACGTKSTATTALFAVPGSTTGDDFYALPYPNDLHRKADGTLDLSKFPTNSPIVDDYRQVAETLDGFALNAALFARFDGPLDKTSLPDPAASTQPGASVYLVDVDPASPDLGQRTPIIADFRADKTNTIGPDRLVVRPYPGFGLDEGTTYALVITNRVHAADGSPIEAAPDFTALLGTGGDAAIAHARTVYQPLLKWLDQPGDDERADVVSAAVFTTQHATFIGAAIRQGVFGTPAPVATNLAVASTATGYTVWTGAYVAPNFQTGTVPYAQSGGEIQVGSDGAAIVQRMEPMRFALMVPSGPTPASGWPICVYQHGTGGDYMTFVDNGAGARLAAQGIATISTDQVLHGPRNPGGDPDTAFFNFANPYAGRDNALQGAADAWSQQRLALGMSFTDAGNRTITFDPQRVMFFGHSQGGLTGPAYIAWEPAVKGAVLSGTGGLLYLSMLYKTQPIDIPALIGALSRDQPMDEDNPSLALAQMWIERADGANYARMMVRQPPPGVTAKSIFQTEGFTDSYAPNPAIEAFATAIGGDEVVLPDEQDVPGLALRGRMAQPAPISGNLDGVTAVLAQYKMVPGSDGHFVVFEVPAAEKQSAEFLGTLAATGTATVVAP
jgi:predicted esterase